MVPEILPTEAHAVAPDTFLIPTMAVDPSGAVTPTTKPDRVVDFAGQFILLNLMKPGGYCQTPSASVGVQNVIPLRL